MKLNRASIQALMGRYLYSLQKGVIIQWEITVPSVISMIKLKTYTQEKNSYMEKELDSRFKYKVCGCP